MECRFGRKKFVGKHKKTAGIKTGCLRSYLLIKRTVERDAVFVWNMDFALDQRQDIVHKLVQNKVALAVDPFPRDGSFAVGKAVHGTERYTTR